MSRPLPGLLVIHRTALLFALAVLGSPVSGAQKRDQETEIKTGTIVEVKEKGRGRILVVEIDGKPHDVPVTPKLDLQIIASGDSGFVRPGQFLSATGTMSNDKLFIKELTITPLRRGQKPPSGKIAKVAAAAGESALAYDVSGVISATQANKDYPEHLDLALKTTGVKAPIMIEPGYTVTVNISDPARIPPNTEAEVTVAPLRGGRISVLGVTVRLATPLTAAEYFGDKPDVSDDKPAADS